MFREVSILGFAVILGGLLLHAWRFPCGYQPRFSIGAILRKAVHLLTLVFPEQRLGLPGKCRKLVFLLGLVSFAVLALTGFGPVVLGGKLHGWLLMLHATFALVFVACGAVVVFLGAGAYTFTRQDAGVIPRRCA